MASDKLHTTWRQIISVQWHVWKSSKFIVHINRHLLISIHRILIGFESSISLCRVPLLSLSLCHHRTATACKTFFPLVDALFFFLSAFFVFFDFFFFWFSFWCHLSLRGYIIASTSITYSHIYYTLIELT